MLLVGTTLGLPLFVIHPTPHRCSVNTLEKLVPGRSTLAITHVYEIDVSSTGASHCVKIHQADTPRAIRHSKTSQHSLPILRADLTKCCPATRFSLLVVTPA